MIYLKIQTLPAFSLITISALLFLVCFQKPVCFNLITCQEYIFPCLLFGTTGNESQSLTEGKMYNKSLAKSVSLIKKVWWGFCANSVQSFKSIINFCLYYLVDNTQLISCKLAEVLL